MKTRFATVALVALCFAAGCADMKGSTKYDEYRAKLDKMSYGEYMAMATHDLAADFGDMFRWHIAAGPGFGVRVQPTKLLQFGFMFAEDARLGWGHRAMGYWTEKRKEGGVSISYYRDLVMQPIYGQPALFKGQLGYRGFTLRDNEWSNWTDAGASVHVAFLGAGAFVSPKEMLDFALNLGVNYPVAIVRPALRVINLRPPEMDYSNDDTPSKLRREEGMIWVPEEPSLPPAEAVNDWIQLPY